MQWLVKVMVVAACLLLWLAPVMAAPVGDVQQVDKLSDGVRITCSSGAILEVRFKAPDLVRVRVVRNTAALTSDHSWALAEHEWPATPWTMEDTPAALILQTSALQVVVSRSPVLVTFKEPSGHVINEDGLPMDVTDHAVRVTKTMGFDEHFYGLGEKAAHLDKRHGDFTMWTSDTPGWTWGTDLLYQSIPFYIGWQDQRAYGIFFDNSCRTEFDLGSNQTQYAEFAAEDGDIDYYFMYGPAMRHVLGLYADLTGHVPLPPRWALGNQQSRWAYFPDTQVEALVKRYRNDRLPLDVIHLDINYMDVYRVFTWDPHGFPDPARFVANLLLQGVHVVTIIDPGVKYQPTPTAPGPNSSYDVFNQGQAHDYFLRHQDGSLWIGKVWPGAAVFVDYSKDDARRWWGDLHHALVDYGVGGIWNDMNEPSDFVDQSGKSVRDVVFNDEGRHGLYPQFRNLFALLEARATFEGLQRLKPRQRPFIISRSGFAGIQRYATMWTGDNRSTWESMAMCLPEFMTLGLSGESFVGCDIGGFIGRCDGELLTRWYQIGFLSPLCRNHHVIDGYDQEPWRFGTAYEDIIRRYLDLRYRLLPYLYTVLEEAHRTGTPWFRPLVLEFPSDPNTVNLDDEVMVGSALLLAPVTRPDQRSRDVYLPPGRWYDFWTHHPLQGGKLVTVSAPLDQVPLYVRGGTILPLGPVMAYVGQKPCDPLEFDIYPDTGGRAHGSLYEDDGSTPDYQQGVSARTTVDVDGTTIHWSGPQGQWKSPSRELVFRWEVPTALLRTRDDGHPHVWALEAAPTRSQLP